MSKQKKQFVITFSEESLPRAIELLGLAEDITTASAYITELDDEEAIYIKLALPGCHVRPWPL